MEEWGGPSLAETPTYAVAVVISVMVALGAFFQNSLEWSAKRLEQNKRKAQVAALEKIKDELMLFGFLSLLMGHWIVYFAKICVKSSTLSSRFHPCVRKNVIKAGENVVFPSLKKLNESGYSIEVIIGRQNHCPKGHEPFVSYESLEPLHRLLFALVIIHVSYSFAAIALAITKIYSWRTWEIHAKRMTIKEGSPSTMRMMRKSTFIFHHNLHPWSKDRVLVWLLCFGRQFWSSINREDYMALRLVFITTHKLPLSYDFHNFMVRSMEEEFRDIVGISVPFWIYAICCILLNIHGTNFYFWFSFLPAVLILLVGTKLQRVVAKSVVEIRDSCPARGHHHLNLRDELFWFGKPKLLLWLVHFITFQNAFEMATFIWSLWEIQGASCFMDDNRFLVTRLIFGIVSQFWCSFVTFPLYVLVTQMGSSSKQALISENTRRSLSMWKQRARRSCTSSSQSLLHETSATSTDCSLAKRARSSSFSGCSMEGGGSSGTNLPCHEAALSAGGSHNTLEELMSGDVYHCIPSSDEYSGHDESDCERT